ncbi:uncharacterized protein [Amphiura filiformis]|uniref:uncharacterized protein n=1 Tax=Amphiura filiformis TaxID=82378 RepID=UPI003B217A3B
MMSWSHGLYSLLALPLLFVIYLVFQPDHQPLQQKPMQQRRNKVFADLTSNKFTRESDGTYGMWSYHGIAHESHADQTEFIYNADLLSHDGSIHTSITSAVYPLMGLTSDMDPVYQEYLILQAKAVGIDGFILEWGYREHQSNVALLSLLQVAKKYKPFNIGINWCDHWLTVDMKNKSSEQIVEKFHADLQYLYDSIFNTHSDLTPMYGSHPIIFLFGDGLSATQFSDILSRPLHLLDDLSTPIWIGSYLNFASTSERWSEWKDLINGTYGWVPNVRRPTPPSMSQWDYYSTTEDTVAYQQNVTNHGSNCVSEVAGCVMWCGSVSPGMDNRGCAGWGRELRYVPRHNLTTHKSSNDLQWEFYLASKKQPDVIVLPTINDFPEATTILPLKNSTFTALYSTLNHTSSWKNVSLDMRGVTLPMQWFTDYKKAEFYNMTDKLNVSNIFHLLESVAVLIGHQDYVQANNTVQIIRQGFSKLERKLTVNTINITGPSKELYGTVPPVFRDNSTYINSTTGLFMALTEDYAMMLRAHNYKGLLRFDYQLLEPKFSHLIVRSSSKRQSMSPGNSYAFYSRNSPSQSGYKVKADFAEVCNLMVKTPGKWKSAVVHLYKSNQSWDHSGKHASDLHFATDASFLLRNISMSFQLYKVKNGR